MKKIKSSLELAMEKLGEMQESREELEKFDEEKYLKAAVHLGNSFLQGKTNKEQVAETIQNYPASIRKKARQAFIANLVGVMDLINTREILEAVSFVGDDNKTREICMETADVFQKFIDRLKADKATLENNTRSALAEELTREGWQGSALAGFNIMNTDQWQEKSTALAAEYIEITNKFKEAIIG